MPNGDTGYSPYQLIHGSELHGPLELYHGWFGDERECIELKNWMTKLDRRLDVIRSALEEKLISRRESGYISSDFSKLKSFEAGDKVLFRVPGLHGKLHILGMGILW